MPCILEPKIIGVFRRELLQPWLFSYDIKKQRLEYTVHAQVVTNDR